MTALGASSPPSLNGCKCRLHRLEHEVTITLPAREPRMDPAGYLIMQHPTPTFQHPTCTRRTALQAGAVGLLGLGMNHVEALRALAAPATEKTAKARAVIYIFLSGGLAQQDSFDMK